MLKYGFDIFDSDEFQNVVLEKEEIEDIVFYLYNL